jgi:Chromatin modification-related protein EAF7
VNASAMKVEDEMHSGNSFLDDTLGELALFKAVAHARPAGAHRYFHIISIRQRIKETAGCEVSIEDLWKKIGSYWHLDAVESNVRLLYLIVVHFWLDASFAGPRTSGITGG